MSIIPIEVAMQHVYADDADQSQVQRKLDSAIATAEQFIGRKIYATNDERIEAKANAETELDKIELFCRDVENGVYKHSQRIADLKIQEAENRMYELQMVMLGLVINPAIEIGILLILGDLYANRENTTEKTANELPMGAKHHLQPFRVMGI